MSPPRLEKLRERPLSFKLARRADVDINQAGRGGSPSKMEIAGRSI